MAVRYEPSSAVPAPIVNLPPPENITPALDAMREAIDAMRNAPAPTIAVPEKTKRVAIFTTDADGMITGATIE